jgi:hypothetical protein
MCLKDIMGQLIGLQIRLTGANPRRAGDIRDENLAVTNLARARCLRCRVN